MVNTDKTDVIQFRNKNRVKSGFNFQFDGVALNIVEKYKYLGTVFSEHLDYDVTSSMLAGAAGRALGGVISKFKALKNVGYHTFYKMFHSSVVPIIDYASGVWGYKNSNAGDKIQFRAVRYYLGVHLKAALLALEGDIGWNTCKMRQHINMIRLWNRMIKMEDNRLTKRVFKWDYQLCKNWCFDLKQILFSVQLQPIYEEMDVCNIRVHEGKLKEQRIIHWRECLPLKPKLRTYMTFKDSINTEDYVKYCSYRKRMSLLAQLRIGILPIHVETGRFRNKKLEERVCFICNNNEIENEVHFVCVCSVYLQFRENLFQKVVNVNDFNFMSDEDKLIYLMNFHWKDLSVYVEKAWDKRNNILYK